MINERPDGALLAGVCAGIARTFKWNVWVLRALFIGFLAIKTVAAILVYPDWPCCFTLSTMTGAPEKRLVTVCIRRSLQRDTNA